MIIAEWPSNVNTKFFDLTDGEKDNAIVNEYIGGRVNGYNKNSRPIQTKNISIRLTKAEQNIFWYWFNSIGGILGAWTCAALGTSVYRFVSVPSAQDTDLKVNVFKLEIEEVY